MSSVQYLREFINERLTAAAEEIFGVFTETIVKYEEEIDRQRKLLDSVLRPELKLHRTELPQQHICKEEEVPPEQQQERNPSLDQEDPEPPQIKDEQEEPCTSQEGREFLPKHETDTCVWIPTYEESDHSEDQILDLSFDETQSVVEDNPLHYMSLINTVAPEANNDHHLVSHSSHEAESQDQSGGKMPFKCDTCGKFFKFNSKLLRHLSVHTGEKPHFCNTCGKRFCRMSDLKTHVRIHTGEKPYLCNTCGKYFRLSSVLRVHMRTHTGEKPYPCKMCERGFRCSGSLMVHMRRSHTGEKPYHCITCGKSFIRTCELARHLTLHTDKQPTEAHFQ